jgi:ABC-type antimicrobial peptide transport system permease subunit
MEELFYDNAEQFSFPQARRMYTWEMLKLIRPALLKNFESIEHLIQHGMIKNYLKVSIRGLIKTPLNSSINLFGLAIAIGIAIFVYAFASWTLNTDQFHERKDNVFLTTFSADRDGSLQAFGTTPRPLGEMLRADFVAIKKVCRVEDRSVIVKYEDNVFHEHIRFADPEFLDMFTFPLKWGDPRTLGDINSIILSERTSIKYFGDENPVGKNILVKFDKDHNKAFKITGVAYPFPKARTIDFNFLINFENLKVAETGYDFHDWNAFVNATFIQVDHPNDVHAIAQGMGKYRTLQNKAVQQPEWAIASFAFEPLATLHIQSEYIRDDISQSSHSNLMSIFFLSVVGAFMLALACLNYINIAIVSATKRLKEIGVRKSIGASRRVIIVQFLSENILTTFFALCIGLVLGTMVFIPWFERLWHFNMGFTFNDRGLWIYLPAILLLTAIASGLYPALYISRFQVVGILKGAVKFGQNNPVTKIFLGFQLILACILITCGVMFTQNSAYLAKRSWGYNPGAVLYAEVPDQLAFEQLQAAMARQPNVLSLSGSAHHLGRSTAPAVLHLPDRDYEADQLSVDAKYFETLQIKLLEGRLFNDHAGSDRQSVVVNEILARNLGWSSAVGQSFEIDTMRYEVVGLVQDFHHDSFEKAVRPTFFKVAEPKDYRYLSTRVRSGSETSSYKTLQAQWRKLFPETPFQGGYQEDVWGNYFEEIGIHGEVWRVFATIAVLLASLGLYGLLTFNVAGRVREFSIRKVLGASTRNLSANITNPYLILFAAALIPAAPISYILVKLLFESAYTYHMPIDYSGVTIALIILILVLFITVSIQIRKVVKTNPVNGLKIE